MVRKDLELLASQAAALHQQALDIFLPVRYRYIDYEDLDNYITRCREIDSWHDCLQIGTPSGGWVDEDGNVHDCFYGGL